MICGCEGSPRHLGHSRAHSPRCERPRCVLLCTQQIRPTRRYTGRQFRCAPLPLVADEQPAAAHVGVDLPPPRGPGGRGGGSQLVGLPALDDDRRLQAPRRPAMAGPGSSSTASGSLGGAASDLRGLSPVADVFLCAIVRYQGSQLKGIVGGQALAAKGHLWWPQSRHYSASLGLSAESGEIRQILSP
jgi:hypothetical protein